MISDARLTLLRTSLDSEPYSNKVTSLCIRKDLGVREHPLTIELDKNKGVLGDRWIWKTWMYLENGDPDPRVQVAVCNARILKLLQEEKNNDYHPGDNIIVDRDLPAEEFSPAARFQIGSAILEVSTVYNDACAKFARELGKDVLKWINLPEHLPLNLRGIYCQIVESGTVYLGDKLQIL
ncbi:MAG: hypothetical protein O7C75_00065 [Verrucomicrobia bacterium]|nr:hypothetical protein [Verrucomicrobiota bacterium]